VTNNRSPHPTKFQNHRLGEHGLLGMPLFGEHGSEKTLFSLFHPFSSQIPWQTKEQSSAGRKRKRQEKRLKDKEKRLKDKEKRLKDKRKDKKKTTRDGKHFIAT